ncbi:MAG: DUF4145 domain-containing protein [Alphaproteobacteria bacterium]
MSNTRINCPHCKAEQVAARITSGAQLPDEAGETRYFFVLVCRKCGFPSIIVARRTATRVGDGAALIKHVSRTDRDPVPNVIEPVGMIPAADAGQTPDDLPANVASAYAEARDCLKRGAVISAAMGFRLTLERATRALNGDPGKSLAERIAALAGNHALPPTLNKWAGEIALISSEPLDQDSDPSPEELHSASGFTEMFLTCAFSLPARIDRRRSSDAGPIEATAAGDPGPAGKIKVLPNPARPRRAGGTRSPGTGLYGI